MELFPTSTYLTKVRTDENMYRFYSMHLAPNLFGGCSLLREWGRIGTTGRYRSDHYEDEGQAMDALIDLMQKKQSRGYSRMN